MSDSEQETKGAQGRPGTAKHSPTPWRWECAYDWGEHLEHRDEGLDAKCENIKRGRIRIVDAEGATVLEDWADFADDGGLSIGDADARLIVSAVNSAVEARALLNETIFYCENSGWTGGNALGDRIRAFLAEPGGGA